MKPLLPGKAVTTKFERISSGRECGVAVLKLARRREGRKKRGPWSGALCAVFVER